MTVCAFPSLDDARPCPNCLELSDRVGDERVKAEAERRHRIALERKLAAVRLHMRAMSETLGPEGP